MKFDFVWNFTEDEKKLISSLVYKGRLEEKKNDRFSIIDFESFYNLFTKDEIKIINKWISAKPNKINTKIPFLGVKEYLNDIVIIDKQIYIDKETEYEIPCQFLPRNVYDAYQKLNNAMKAEINKELLILFGYRSPARQAFVFFDILEGIYNFDFNKTIQRVCHPNYSEHVCNQKQAIDFITKDGLICDDFDKTMEYIWLQNNAKRFCFYESYPKDNNLDMMYEPWHWHYETSDKKLTLN